MTEQAHEPAALTQREALARVGEAVDKQTQQIERIRGDLMQFRDAVTGVPGLSLGALGELRQEVATALSRVDILQKGLPNAIDTALQNSLSLRRNRRLSRLGAMSMILVAAVAGGVGSGVTAVLSHLGTH